MLEAALGRVIRRLRDRRGLSQEAFGYRVGVHRTYVSQIERGTKSVTVRTLTKIAAELGVTPGDLICQAEREAASAPAPREAP